MINRYYYSKHIEEFLKVKEEHFILLAELDETYEALLIKMFKVLEVYNDNTMVEFEEKVEINK